MLLEVKDISTYYDAIQALKGISLHVNDGEVVSIIGANGAGKTTLLKTIAGHLRPSKGSIFFQGKDITRLPAHQIVRLGISQVMEGRQLFGPLSVLENLRLGMYVRHGSPKEEIEKDFDLVFQLFPVLKERANQEAATLSGGEQQMLAIGRALMCRPRLLLLDEPSMGLAPLVVDSIFSVLGELNRQGLTVLLVEQNATMALEVSHRCYVLEVGKIVFEGEAQVLKEREEKVIASYLGIPDEVVG